MMQIPLRAIGNSKGVILPANLLKTAGITDAVMLDYQDGTITLRPAKQPRDGWAEALALDPPHADEPIFMDDVTDAPEDWTW